MTWWKCIDKTYKFKRNHINSKLSAQLLKALSEEGTAFKASLDEPYLEDTLLFNINHFSKHFSRITFKLRDNSSLSISCADVSALLELLKSAEKKTFTDSVDYYAVTTSIANLILSADERESLIFQVSGKVKLAEQLKKEQKSMRASRSEYTSILDMFNADSMYPIKSIDLRDLFASNKKDDTEEE